MMKEKRPWLITIRCANHRLELALNNAAKEIPKLAECGKFHTNNSYFFKNSGTRNMLLLHKTSLITPYINSQHKILKSQA